MEATGVTYGFIQSTNITVTAASAAETAFTAKAQHSASSAVFTVDANGNISKIYFLITHLVRALVR